MIFYALKDDERIYTLEMPVDDGAVHLPDLAKLGITDFQVKYPQFSLREDRILFGFSHS